MGKWTRRAFIGVGTVVGGGILLGVGGVAFAPNRLSVKGRNPDPAQIATWLRITPDNAVTVVIPHADVGQGAHTALAMMLADELDADWKLVRTEEAPAQDAYANGYLVEALFLGGAPPAFLRRGVEFATAEVAAVAGLQITGGSLSVRATGALGMRVAGAAARAMLIKAAAQAWGVGEDGCTAALSMVHHAASGRSVSYGAVASAAALLSIPDRPVLKAHDQWRIMGTSVPRFDLPAKVDGSAVYGIDIVLPDMLYATVGAAPVFGAKLVSVDDAPAMAMAGVHSVVRLEGGVAVVADGYWHAVNALRALHPVYDDSKNREVDSATIASRFDASFSAGDAKTDHSLGAGLDGLKKAAVTVEAEYSVPYLAHGTMEPPNATVRIAGGHCEVWTGVQDPLNARNVAAKAAGLSGSDVTLHNQVVGGGFGRKLPFALDFIDQAVRVAKTVAPAPVKLIWSREEDIAHDFYRPAAVMRLKGGVDAWGSPVVWTSHMAGGPGILPVHMPYVIANQHMVHSIAESHVRDGFWRSVEFSYHGFFIESFVDELALAATKDPVAFRHDMLPENSRHRAVLAMAAGKSGWGTALPAGRGRGVALMDAFGSICAQVAEVEIGADGVLKIHRVTAVVDCGDVVNPDTATAQIEGGIMFGLSAALYGEVTIDKGAVVQRNFYDYKVAHMKDAPEVDVYFINSHAPMGGIGEVGVPPLAPALTNAIFAATGKRVRKLPLTGQDLSAARKV